MSRFLWFTVYIGQRLITLYIGLRSTYITATIPQQQLILDLTRPKGWRAEFSQVWLKTFTFM